MNLFPIKTDGDLGVLKRLCRFNTPKSHFSRDFFMKMEEV